MSSTELNKGRMIPVEESVEEIAEKCISDLGAFYECLGRELRTSEWERVKEMAKLLGEE